MMREFKKCLKCDKIFESIESQPYGFERFDDKARQLFDGICPRCGGRVIWVNIFNEPIISDDERKKYRVKSRLYFLSMLFVLVSCILALLLIT